MLGLGGAGKKGGGWNRCRLAVWQMSGTLCTGQPLPVSAGDATPKRLLPQEYGDCTGLETEVSIFSTKVAEP